MTPSIVKTGRGQRIQVGPEVAKGGEGIVLRIQGQPDLLLKIYLPGKADSRQEKVKAIVSANLSQATKFATFPIDYVTDTQGRFSGFVMRNVANHKPIHFLYTPSNRKIEFSKASFLFLVRSALNSARAVAAIHDTGCVIGDINHSGFLVSEQATITLIDADSFQVHSGAELFPCLVGVREFTPPELQGKKLDKITRTANHDAFGLAVIVFQLLFMGRHPFAGRYRLNTDMPLERSIGEYRFAYSNLRRQNTLMDPPPGVPQLSDFSDEIAGAFERAFGPEGSTKGRPSARDWVAALERLERTLIVCSANSAHHHVKGSPCPWCRMEAATPGFVAFVDSRIFSTTLSSINISSFEGALLAVGDLPPISSIHNVLTNLGILSPSASARESGRITKRRFLLGAAIDGVGLALIAIAPGAIFIGLMIIAAGTYYAFKSGHDHNQYQTDLRAAELAWETAQQNWAQQPSGFSDRKLRASADIKALAKIPTEEARALLDLETQKRAKQLERFLAGYRISDAKIRKIGSGRKTTLASWGVATAAEVDAPTIQRIPGFGSGLAQELLAWRMNIEARFVFRPNEATNPADIAATKAGFAQKRAQLTAQITAAIQQLQQDKSQSGARRKALVAQANSAAARLEQVRVDRREATFTTSIGWLSKIALVGALALGIPNALSLKSTLQASQSNSSAQISQKTVFSQQGPRAEPSKNDAINSTAQPATAFRPSQSSNGVQANPSRVFEQSAVSAQQPKPADMPTASTAPPLSPPIEVAASHSSFDASPNFDAHALANSFAIQQRLYELGYLASAPNPEWGATAKAALRSFKMANALEANDEWNEGVGRALRNATAVRANQTIFGGWAPSRDMCPGVGETDLAPMLISSNRAETGLGVCEFKSLKRKSASSYVASAVCIVDGKSKNLTISLSASNDRLTWKSQSSSSTYYRCR